MCGEGSIQPTDRAKALDGGGGGLQATVEMGQQMRTADNSGAIVRPPIAWALAILAGIGLDQLYPLPFVPAAVPRAAVGGAMFAAGFLLAIWAIATIRRSGSRIETSQPTTTIVESGPYRFTRNPIYTGMFLGQVGLAIGFDSLWVLATLLPFYFVIRYGVVAREEAYLEGKFGAVYLGYKSRVRRWL
jgi:protein-S-isoprenylcysteine O-methyltransferase Ste14